MVPQVLRTILCATQFRTDSLVQRIQLRIFSLCDWISAVSARNSQILQGWQGNEQGL